VKRETTEEALLAIHEQLHDLRDTLNGLALRVDILWEERKRQSRGPRQEDRR
jgi:hypothetical protein